MARIDHVPLVNGQVFKVGETIDVLDPKGHTLHTYVVRRSGPGWIEVER